MFRPLSENQIVEIAALQITLLKEMLAKNGVQIVVTKAAIHRIAEAGYDPHYGARPVKRVIQKQLMNELSKMILSGRVSRDLPITIDADDQGLVFRS